MALTDATLKLDVIGFQASRAEKELPLGEVGLVRVALPSGADAQGSTRM